MATIRYSIGEWYGEHIPGLAVESLRELANGEALDKDSFKLKLCPPRCSTGNSVRCSKRHGVCSIRGYVSVDGEAEIATGPEGRLTTICPHRFEEDSMIYAWISETLLGTSEFHVLPEIKFLAKTGALDAPRDGAVGKIDNIVVHRDSSGGLRWCAVEKQAVYFSGKAMDNEWTHISTHPGRFPFPKAHRHPDFRSSGVKRLMPQLQIKIPTLRTWGIKMAVVVDSSFFDSLGKMNESLHPSNAEMSWFVVKYEESAGRARLVRDRVVYTTLDSAVSGLTAGVPLPKEAFEAQIKKRLSLIEKAR